MNPSIRILCLLVFAGFAATGDPVQLLVAWAMLALAYAWPGCGRLSGLGTAIRRVRWLLLSLVLLYGWFTPGLPLLPALGPLSATVEGVQAGLARALALLAMVLAVHLLLSLTPRQQLIAALIQLQAPLGWLGFGCERFAARMLLVIETVPQVQILMKEQLQESYAGASAGIRRLAAPRRMAQATQRVFDAVLERAEQSPLVRVQFPEPEPVAPYQWLYPVLMVMSFVMAAMYAHSSGY